MEKRIKRPAGLTALFWRYLITTSAVILLLAVLWWMGLTILMQMKFVYPASTAADGVDTRFFPDCRNTDTGRNSILLSMGGF